MKWIIFLCLAVLMFYCSKGASAAKATVRDTGGRQTESGASATAAGTATTVVAAVGGVVLVLIAVIICVVAAKRVNPHVRRDGPPEWAHSLEFRPELNGGFNATSDGLENVTPYHVIRTRIGMFATDAARWARGLTEGKHVFEIFWPDKKNRGTRSCIGLGTDAVPLRVQGRVSLVGALNISWGLDLSRRRSLHQDKCVQRLVLAVPPRFYMYVDIDSGMVGFGADVMTYGKSAEFYGYILTNLPKNPEKPLYVMVSSCSPQENIHVYYKGTAVPTGGYDICDLPPIQDHNHQQQQQPRFMQQQQPPYPPPVHHQQVVYVLSNDQGGMGYDPSQPPPPPYSAEAQDPTPGPALYVEPRPGSKEKPKQRMPLEKY